VIKTTFRVGVIGLVATYLMGCASAMSPVSGAWYTDVKGPLGVTDAYGGTAMGEACASSILGLIATGDASIDAAKKNGGVAQVTAVDHKSTSILGITAKFCTIVYGKKGASGAPKM
jgi:hypothetical protein